MDHWQKSIERAENTIKKALEKPIGIENVKPRMGGVLHGDDAFDPWDDLLPYVYGSYSSEFNDLAISVLTDIKNNQHPNRGLAAEMFREMLCRANMCDYGSSPRVCFWNLRDDLLDKLIDKWIEYSRYMWQE